MHRKLQFYIAVFNYKEELEEQVSAFRIARCREGAGRGRVIIKLSSNE